MMSTTKAHEARCIILSEMIKQRACTTNIRKSNQTKY